MSTRWPIGAACIAAAAVLASCDVVETAPAWPASIDVPRIRTLGRIPAPEERVVVTRDGDGIAIDGQVVTFEQLTSRLAERGRVLGWKAGPGDANPAALVVAFDGDAPWGLVQWTLQSAAAPTAMTDRIFFAARHVPTGEAGALAVFLPKDRGLRPPQESPRTATVRVRIGSDAAIDAGSIYAHFRDMTAKHGAWSIEVDAARSTRFGAVLEVLDAAHLAGARGATFVGTPPPDSTLARLRPPLARHVKIDGAEVTKAAAVLPDTPGPASEFAGFTDNAETLALEESAPLEERPPEVDAPEEAR